MSPKDWNPRASSCSQCPELQDIVVQKSPRLIDQEKKFCQKWKWEITDELGKTQAVCKISFKEQRRQRRRKK